MPLYIVHAWWYRGTRGTYDGTGAKARTWYSAPMSEREAEHVAQEMVELRGAQFASWEQVKCGS